MHYVPTKKIMMETVLLTVRTMIAVKIRRLEFVKVVVEQVPVVQKKIQMLYVPTKKIMMVMVLWIVKITIAAKIKM